MALSGSAGNALEGLAGSAGNALEAILEALPDGLLVIDPDGQIRLVNRQAELLFGYSRDELEGQPVEMLIPDFRGVQARDPQPPVDDPTARPLWAGLRLAAHRKDGTDFPIDVALGSIDTEGGQRVSIALRDISELQAIEAKFAALLDAAPDAIVGIDSGGTIRLVNRQTETLFGYSRTELVGQPIEILVPAHLREIHVERRSQSVEDPHGRARDPGLEITGVRKNGSEFPIDVHLSAVDSGGDVRFTAAIRDITHVVNARRNAVLEARAEQAQRLQSLGRLAGGVAHDFNNLLAIILMYAGFVTEDAEDPTKVREGVEEIRHAADRAGALTRQLLVFGGREAVCSDALNVNDVLVETQGLLQSAVGGHIELLVRANPDVGNVPAERTEIEQVLLNLAVNSADAMGNGGTVIIETSERTIGPDDDGDTTLPPGRYVCLSVSDTGSGMSVEAQRHAFEPFFSTKPRGEGTGLGLATVYGIATGAGGGVTLKSEAGVGTTVTVYLPVTDAVPAPHEASVEDPTPASGRTILVVEDEAQVRQLTKRTLEGHGYRVLVADAAEKALEMLADGRSVDLILTDVGLPGVSGRKLAAQAAAMLPDVRILLMSGSPQGTAPQGEADGALPLLEKPFSSEELLTRVGMMFTEPLPTAGRS